MRHRFDAEAQHPKLTSKTESVTPGQLSTLIRGYVDMGGARTVPDDWTLAALRELQERRSGGETTREAARDADHCDFPDCEQHYSAVVANIGVVTNRPLPSDRQGCVDFLVEIARIVKAAQSPVKTSAPRCQKHGVELAFEGDGCWECSKEER
jgi:hypothetical protein